MVEKERPDAKASGLLLETGVRLEVDTNDGLGATGGGAVRGDLGQ